ncbi:MAG: hypothetical protein AABW45_00565 [Nanoarchaeota archaeon]
MNKLESPLEELLQNRVKLSNTIIITPEEGYRALEQINSECKEYRIEFIRKHYESFQATKKILLNF